MSELNEHEIQTALKMFEHASKYVDSELERLNTQINSIELLIKILNCEVLDANTYHIQRSEEFRVYKNSISDSDELLDLMDSLITNGVKYKNSITNLLSNFNEVLPKLKGLYSQILEFKILMED